jgi:mRNA interferase RelE/StbE
MKYRVTILRRAQKSLEKIRGADYEKIKTAIINLGDNTRPQGCKKLSGRDGWRIRIGVYRVLYEIKDAELIIMVVDVGHRREIYR